MVDLRGKTIVSQFGEYKDVHESGFKPEIILSGSWVPFLSLRKKLIY